MEIEIMIARDRLLNVIAKYHSNHDWDSVLRAVDDYTAFMAVAPAFIFKEVKHKGGKMIENKEQLERTEHWIEVFKKTIESRETSRSFWSRDVHLLVYQAEIDGMKSKLKELEEEVVRYTNLVQLTEGGGKTIEEEYEDTVHPPWQQPDAFESEKGGDT